MVLGLSADSVYLCVFVTVKKYRERQNIDSCNELANFIILVFTRDYNFHTFFTNGLPQRL